MLVQLTTRLLLISQRSVHFCTLYSSTEIIIALRWQLGLQVNVTCRDRGGGFNQTERPSENNGKSSVLLYRMQRRMLPIVYTPMQSLRKKL